MCVSLWQWRFPLQMVRTGETTTYLWLGVQVGNHKWIIFKCHRGFWLMDGTNPHRRRPFWSSPSCAATGSLQLWWEPRRVPGLSMSRKIQVTQAATRRRLWFALNPESIMNGGQFEALQHWRVRTWEIPITPWCLAVSPCLLVQIVDPGQRSVAEVLRYQTSMRNRNHCQWVYNRNELFMIEQGSLSFVIKHCNGKAPINGGFNMIRIFKWGIFHCSVSLNIIFGGHKKKICSAPKRKGRKPRPVNQPSTTPTRWRLPVSWSFSSWSQQNDQVPCPPKWLVPSGNQMWLAGKSAIDSWLAY